MKVFISSVRRGLEQERDALPGLILALGHDPLRFEDFTAQSSPSREVCLRGVSEADVYLLLVGAHYGTVFPETGMSPTHEEHVAALAKGIPRLVFRKNNVDLDEEQAAFLHEIEEYGTGIFRGNFTDAVDLQPKVATALRDMPAGPLTWHPLPDSPVVSWRAEWPELGSPDGAQLCVHAVPSDETRLARRQLTGMPEHFAARLRLLGLVASSSAIGTGVDATGAYATLPQERRRGWQEVDDGALLGCRIDLNGQRSVWERLPADGMGSILDRDQLAEQIARDLRLLGSLTPLHGSLYALAAELQTTSMASLGSISELGRRTSATFGSSTSGNVRAEPEELVSRAAFDAGSSEAASVLAEQLLASFQH